MAILTQVRPKAGTYNLYYMCTNNSNYLAFTVQIHITQARKSVGHTNFNVCTVPVGGYVGEIDPVPKGEIDHA